MTGMNISRIVRYCLSNMTCVSTILTFLPCDLARCPIPCFRRLRVIERSPIWEKKGAFIFGRAATSLVRTRMIGQQEMVVRNQKRFPQARRRQEEDESASCKKRFTKENLHI